MCLLGFLATILIFKNIFLHVLCNIFLINFLDYGLFPESTGSEQVIVDALTGHAQKIAAQILSRSEAGRDLENDIRVN